MIALLEQLQFGSDGVIRDKVETAIKRLQEFEPPDGYFLAFSGGRDSQCIYHLAKIANVNFEAHYSVVSCDPPEVVRFVKENYPDVIFDRQRWPDGRPVTMWNLIPEKRMPPTRIVRYCCEKLKESNGYGRVTVTGVRWAESTNRKRNQGMITIFNGNTRIKNKLEEMGAEFSKTYRGGCILNLDNDISRRAVEYCYRTNKIILNPIIDWTDDDVWQFLNGNGIPHCSLYDEGFNRIGCIGCPLGGSEKMKRDFERWPKYKELYLKAFEKMISKRKEDGLETEWETADEVMNWWLKEDDHGKQ